MPAIPPSGLTAPAVVYAWSGTRFAGSRAAALFALDAALGQVVRTTREPLVGQMRLTWWHDALELLAHAPPPAQPVLQALAAAGLTGDGVASMVDGWEELLEPDLTEAALLRYATARGSGLFRALTGETASATVDGAGGGWALADLAAHVTDAALGARAAALAASRLTPALAARWAAPHRAAGAVALDASMALARRGAAGSPRRAAAVLRFRLLGRALPAALARR